MRFENKPFTILMKLLIGTLSLMAFWASWVTFGASAGRLFFTWLLLAVSIYYLVVSAILAFSGHPADYLPFPVLSGMLLVSVILVSGTSFTLVSMGIEIPLLTGLASAIAYGTLPVLMFADWLLFAKKGQFRAVYPFYWLALPTFYAAAIIFTAEFLPSNTTFLYPVVFLDCLNYGFENFCTVILSFTLVTLMMGYILLLIDGLISGNLSKYVVLPRIKTVEIEESDHR